MHINPINANPPPAVLPLPDYKTAEKVEWRKNARIAYRNSNMVSTRRIETYRWKFGSTPSLIRAKIQNDRMFAATFAKNPVHTGFEKTVAHKWLTQYLNLPAIDILPKDPQSALYVTNSGLITTVASKRKPSKALNFCWRTNNLTFYALHKYTPNSGGTQGRQLEQEEKILTNFQQATDPNKVLIVIVDGDYYTDIRHINQRIGVLRNLANRNTPKSFAVHMQHVPWAIGLCP